MAAATSVSPAAATWEMSTDTAGASRSMGRLVGPSKTPLRAPVHSVLRVWRSSLVSARSSSGVSASPAASS